MKLGIKNKLILLGALIADFYEEFSSRNLYRFWYEMGGSDYKRKSYVQILSKMIKEKELKKRTTKNEIFLKFNTKAEEKLKKIIPQWRYRKFKWDKKWRLLIFDIEEERRIIRDLLRKKIKELGFVLWQESVYVSPFPIEKEINQYLKEKNLYPKAICFTAKKLGDEDDRDLAYKIFRLDKIRRSYREILKKLNEIEKGFREKIVNKQEMFKKVKNLYDQFQMLVFEDPFLPEGLVPKDWERDLISKKIRKLLF